MSKSFLQSPAWAKFQRSLGREVVLTDKYLAIVEQGQIGRRLFLPYGPDVKSAAEFKSVVTELVDIAKRQKIDFIRLEPLGKVGNEDLMDAGFVRSRAHLEPEDTIVNDLSRPIGMKAVREVRRFERRLSAAGKEIKFSISQQSQDVRYFLDMMHDVAARTGMRPHPDHYFSSMAASLLPDRHASLLFAEIDGEKVASALLYLSDDTVIYAHAASLTDFRQYSPALMLANFALKWAKKRGFKYWDWYGVAPEDAGHDHKWHGLTQFKASFGGQREHHVGTWELPVKKLKYQVYRGLQKFL
ncbi:MAG: peptidoglycan bridge formation glycyltransferase FemA/FemB family protein [Candidatus Nomurabacteria bacterium]|nr:peptidoglycan bridge formation glycyltransferase FemA/FemB family protein [Candidatus Nomurabacteria bacterium]